MAFGRIEPGATARVRVVSVRAGQSGGLFVLTADGLVYLFTMNSDASRGGDAQTHLVAANVYDRDLDVITIMIVSSRRRESTSMCAPPRSSVGVRRCPTDRGIHAPASNASAQSPTRGVARLDQTCRSPVARVRRWPDPLVDTRAPLGAALALHQAGMALAALSDSCTSACGALSHASRP